MRLSRWHWGGRGHGLFYGWVIVAVALGIISALFGIRFSFGVLFGSIQGEFQLSRTVTSSIYSSFLVFCAVFATFSGWAIDKYGPRPAVSAMGLLTGLGLFLISRSTSLWQVFLSYSLVLAAGTSAPVPMLSTVVSKWFVKKRGTAVGLATSGTGWGILVVAPLASYLIADLGWRTALVVLGLGTSLFVVPLAMLLRGEPRDIGLLPDGVKLNTGVKSTAVVQSRKHTGVSLVKIWRSAMFWLIGGIWFLFGFCLSLVMTHLVPYATDVGISITEASTVLSLMSGFQIIAQFSVGRISDIVGRKVPIIICALLGTGSFIWLSWSHELWMFYIFAIFFGLSWGGVNSLSLLLASDTFEGHNIGQIMGLLTVGWSIGNVVGSTLGGFVFDVTGRYSIAFGAAAGAMLTLAALCALTKKQTSSSY